MPYLHFIIILHQHKIVNRFCQQGHTLHYAYYYPYIYPYGRFLSSSGLSIFILLDNLHVIPKIKQARFACFECTKIFSNIADRKSLEFMSPIICTCFSEEKMICITPFE